MVDIPAVFPAWPGDAEVAVALTFDVDGEAAWPGEGPQNGRRLTLLSHSGLLADPAAVERIWLGEFESARQEHRAVTYTMHPEAIGRGYLARMLRRVITGMLGCGRPWFATHAQIAALANEPAAQPPALDPRARTDSR